MMQKRQGMDIKQMKTFVSEELKGLKQEHRLLSLREYLLISRQIISSRRLAFAEKRLLSQISAPASR